jgi:hypothetical protein
LKSRNAALVTEGGILDELGMSMSPHLLEPTASPRLPSLQKNVKDSRETEIVWSPDKALV